MSNSLNNSECIGQNLFWMSFSFRSVGCFKCNINRPAIFFAVNSNKLIAFLKHREHLYYLIADNLLLN
jgi:hypothetical protein